MNFARLIGLVSVVLFAMFGWASGGSASTQSTETRNAQRALPKLNTQEPLTLVSVGDATDPECKDDPLVLAASGKTIPPECVMLGWKVYEARDGSKATLTHGAFDSPNVARERLYFWMKRAKQIIQDEERKNAAGNVIGHRIVAAFESEDGQRSYFKVAWTDGNDCYLIGSGSLPTALSLETWALQSRQPVPFAP